jgi:hypothetical protein
VLAHGNIGCTKVANQFENATEELSAVELCTRIEASRLSNEIIVTIKLYACGAGGRAEVVAGCTSGAVLAGTLANMLPNQYGYSNARIYGYTKSVSTPERNNNA